MNEFFQVTGWIITGLELFIVLFLLYSFKQYRFALFFGGKNTLKKQDDHELHSCFLSSLAILVFYTSSSSLGNYILSMPFELIQMRQVYYFALVCTGAAFMTVLYLLHAIRGCSFSTTARVVAYIAVALMCMNFAQLVLRGYLNSDILFDVYGPFVVIVNVITFVTLAKYPFYKLMESRLAKGEV
ncbi:hypothetical protein CWB99_16175 [Pseudoalteromonas rubra]|uniref:Uncharacterized protein n=1 Tax=Pseudoalteromonas rubra TaxID=43658 RepID=A0A5S3WK49_9GAMM|nr:hypothetical protein [Pseudoalteromonas rubra]TMP27048.1 hypothetical protein CWB99_16175 [Pseudoalteromonas rubra]TMP36187.1 hypothetical protein CWC00_02930 [Pseudoalteromonas rubra]